MSKKKERKAIKVVKLYKDTHAFLKLISFKESKDMCDCIDDVLKEKYPEYLEEFKKMQKDNK